MVPEKSSAVFASIRHSPDITRGSGLELGDVVLKNRMTLSQSLRTATLPR